VTLEELTPWLFSRTSAGIRWGLERTERLLAGVGDPHRHFRSLHIAGTNGKGSVAALCDAALRAEGAFRVGLYTSPHLVSFNERVRIDGVPVADDVLVAAAERLRPEIEALGATFFEATTAVAFLVFAEAGADVVVAEVGLGGRLDSTNVLAFMVTGVTHIASDYIEYFGAGLPGIAREKAGIFKPGVPALCGATEPGVEDVLREVATAVGASFRRLDDLVELGAVDTGLGGTGVEISSAHWGRRRIRTPLVGAHQARNAAFAAELLALLPDDARPSWAALEAGFAAVRWPGRMQVERVRGTTYLLDVAHNPDGARTLAAALDTLDLPRPIVLVAGILADKEWREMLRPLTGRASATVLTTAPSAPATRAWDPEEAARYAGEELGRAARVIPDLAAALRRASTLAPHGTVVVTGSVHTVGDSLVLLGLSPP